MHRSPSAFSFLQPALSALVLCACAADVGGETSEPHSGTQQTSTPVNAPPSGARLLPADPTLSIEQALARLHSQDTQKDQGGVNCDSTPRIIEARGVGDNLVTADWEQSGRDQGILRASVPWAEYGGPKEGFLLCSLGADEALYSLGNGKYVSVELGDDWSGDSAATLRARADEVGPWERFRIQPVADDIVVLRSIANYRLVSAERGYEGDRYGTLRARATRVGDWEQFVIK